MNFEEINKLIDKGYIRKTKHPHFDLFIYNYTAKTQYDNVWTNETMACRGLITNGDDKVIARPFIKFFNISQIEKSNLTQSFKVYEKLDGSLGILYFYHNIPYIATRGSFSSSQAIEANNMLHSIYYSSIPKLDKKFTYLFEIIYPDNQIIVNYGDRKSLTLLAVIETDTGKEYNVNDFYNIGFPVAKQCFHINDINSFTSLNNINEEGFVIIFENGVRAKFKFEQYVKLHSFITEMSTKKIWDALKNNISLEEIINNIPDELYKWVQEKIAYFTNEYKKLNDDSEIEFKRIMELIPNGSRKELAMVIMNYKYPQLLFSKLDNKDTSKIIWKILEHEYELPNINNLNFKEDYNYEKN